MHRRRTSLAAVLVGACLIHAAAADSPIFANGFEAGSSDIGSWLENINLHNATRASVFPAASPPLAPLRWSASVAAVAQAYANQCIWAHNPNRGYLGENLAANTATVGAEAAAALMWADEAPYYNYAANTCASGQMCGHYTQMVWRATTEIGCGIKRCSSGAPWGPGAWTLVVCDYSPPGNYNGQRPY